MKVKLFSTGQPNKLERRSELRIVANLSASDERTEDDMTVNLDYSHIVT